MSRVIVTGAGGFLGKRLVEVLLQKTDTEVIAITSQESLFTEKVKVYNQRLQIVATRKIHLIEWENTDCIINLAFPMNADGIQLASGLDFTALIGKVAKEHDIRAVINISSQSVYDENRSRPAEECDLVCPNSKYAIGKYAAELIMDAECSPYVFHTNIRLASLVGPGLDARVINKFIAQIMKGEKIHIIGGTQRFGFLDVRDAVDGLMALMMSNPAQWKKVYNLGSNNSWSLEEIAMRVCKIGQMNFNMNACYEIEKADVRKNSSLNCSLFQNSFHWSDRFSLDDMIVSIYEEYMKKEK